MRVIILKDYNLISNWVSNYIHSKISNAQDKFVLGLPTGSTPLCVYKNLIDQKTNFKNVTTFNMDEYIGLEPNHSQSYHYFMNKHLFNKVNINKNNINIPNGIAPDINLECINYEKKIKESGGIDLFLCGIGSDGHIAFNEPGSSFNSLTRIKTLTQKTINDNARFFDDKNKVPRTAITVGIKTITDAKEIIIMASGLNKSQAIKNVIEEGISTNCPASIAQMHKNAVIVIDFDAANELSYKTVQYYLNMQKNIDLLGNPINNNLLKYFNDNDKILITSPHPDDDVIGMGGLMDILPYKNNVNILYMTNGKGGIRDIDYLGPMTRIKEGISSVKILGYEKEQVIYKQFPFYNNKSREINKDDSKLFLDLVVDLKPCHIFICSDPDPKNTHIKCLEIIKNSNINDNVNIWLYKSAWQKWSECNILPNIDFCINKTSFYKKLQAIDMHISQINPLVFKDNKINSFKDITIDKNKSIKYFEQFSEKFYHCSFKDFKKLTDYY